MKLALQNTNFQMNTNHSSVKTRNDFRSGRLQTSAARALDPVSKVTLKESSNRGEWLLPTAAVIIHSISGAMGLAENFLKGQIKAAENLTVQLVEGKDVSPEKRAAIENELRHQLTAGKLTLTMPKSVVKQLGKQHERTPIVASGVAEPATVPVPRDSTDIRIDLANNTQGIQVAETIMAERPDLKGAALRDAVTAEILKQVAQKHGI